jgi:hypothetical protein
MKKKASPAAMKYNSLMENHFSFRLLDNIKYELPILAFLLIIYAFKHDFYSGDVYNIVHIYDYRIGFTPRMFIGSLMTLFTDYKSIAFINMFFNIFCILSIFLFSFAAGRVIRKADDKVKNTAMIFVLLFLAVPYSRTVLYPRLVSIDRFLVVFTLLALIAISKKGFKWILPVLIFMSLATYQGYAFTYMPVIAILLIYEIYRNKNSRQSIALLAVCFTTMAVFSAYFFLYKGITSFQNVEDLVAYASNKTDIRNSVGEFDIKLVLNNFFFVKPNDLFWKITVPRLDWSYFKYEIRGIIYLLPLLIIFFLIWKNAIKNSLNKFDKFIYIMCMLAPLARMPMYILSTNLVRGRISVVVVQFFLVFYFLYVGDSVVSASAKKIGDILTKNYLLLAALVVYITVFVKLN